MISDSCHCREHIPEDCEWQWNCDDILAETFLLFDYYNTNADEGSIAINFNDNIDDEHM